jgi:thiol-disulfide isomerase/thioredoxin
MEVQLISATWCKRCQTIKPEVISLSSITGATLTILDYDEMEETDPIKEAIKSLPTIRLKINEQSEWRIYTAATITEFKADIIGSISAINGSTDF